MSEPLAHHPDVYAVLNKQASVRVTQAVDTYAGHPNTLNKALEHAREITWV